MLSESGKTLAAAAVALLMLILSFITHHGAPTTGQWLEVLTGFFTAAVVWLAPRTTRWPWIKTACYGVLAVLNVFSSLLIGDHGHLVEGEWVNLAIGILGTLAVAKSPAVVHGPTAPVAVDNRP